MGKYWDPAHSHTTPQDAPGQTPAIAAANGPLTGAVTPAGLESDARVTHHMHLVRRIAWRLHRRAANHTDLDDLVQTGLVALVEASRSWEDRGFAFATYAQTRIRGAMIDSMRRGATLGRAAVSSRNEVQAHEARLTAQWGRPPTAAEMAAALGISMGEWAQLRATIEPARTESLDALYHDGDSAFADPAEAADLAMIRDEGTALLASAVARLPEREAMILQLYFVEELSLEEIGSVLGVGAARVCQIKKVALGRMRSMIEE